ncbi:MAG: GntP family permease [Bacteroidetes bacterium]|nr:GntP family permease [Bacteroidota bacterium]
MITIIFLLFIIGLIVITATKNKLHPFLALLLAALMMGFIMGLDVSVLIKSLTQGFGNTLSSIGVIIAFGTIIGVYIEKSGGTLSMANAILKIVGEKKSALAMNLTGFIVSIPVFCDSGFVILSTLNKALSRKSGISLVVFAVALSTGLYATHVFVPPTPGPLAAAAILEADLGLVIIFGLIVAVFSSYAGYLWAKYIGKKIKITGNDDLERNDAPHDIPKTSLSFAPIFIPLVLIAFKSISDYPTYPFGEGLVHNVIYFLGNPVIALFIGVFLSFSLKRDSKSSHLDWVTIGLKEAGVIILITGAGGAFGNILRAGEIGEIIGSNLADLKIGILLPFIIAAVLKSAQGSSTVAIITTAAIVAPLLESLGLVSQVGRVLAVLSIGAGSMTVSHLNDSFFWVVAQFSDMDTSTALKSQTSATFIQGIVGMGTILILTMIFI